MVNERIRRNEPPVIATPKLKVKDVMGQIPAKYISSMKGNMKIKSCCRKAEDHQIQTFRTHKEAIAPDLAIMECSTCGAKHYRAAVGGGKMTG